jgi:hypothetical protein
VQKEKQWQQQTQQQQQQWEQQLQCERKQWQREQDKRDQREREQREQQEKEKAAQEQQERDKQKRDKQEQEQREQEQRERDQRERDKQEKEKAAREQKSIPPQPPTSFFQQQQQQQQGESAPTTTMHNATQKQLLTEKERLKAQLQRAQELTTQALQKCKTAQANMAEHEKNYGNADPAYQQLLRTFHVTKTALDNQMRDTKTLTTMLNACSDKIKATNNTASSASKSVRRSIVASNFD